MNTKTGFLFFFCWTASVGFSQVLLQPESHKFGEVRPGKHYVVKAKVINSSPNPVTLSQPRTDCRCVAAKIGEVRLKPKAFTWLTVDYNPEVGDKGQKYSKIFFTALSKDKNKKVISKEMEFHFTAEIKSDYSLVPGKMESTYMGTSNAATLEGKLTLDKSFYSGWSFLKAEADSNTLTVEVKEIPKQLAYQIKLKIPSRLPPGNYEGKIKIEGSGKKGGVKFEYPYQVIVKSMWNVDPNQVTLGELDGQKLKNWKRDTFIRQVYGKSFKIEKIQNVPSWLKYDIKKAENLGGVRIHWEINVEKLRDKREAVKPLPEVLTLVFDSKEEKTFSLPLKAFWPREKTIRVPKEWTPRDKSAPFLKDKKLK